MKFKDMNVVVSSAFLPSISYFSHIQKSEEVIVDIHEFYEKQSFRNRTHILTSQGELVVSVPIKKPEKSAIVKDIKIDYSNQWDKLFLRTLQSAYGKSPFFEYYFESFQIIIDKKHAYLSELNANLLAICLKLLKQKKSIKYSEFYSTDYESYIDLRGGNSHLNLEMQTYIQVFGQTFVKDLSIIDLLFCEGPNATNILNSSITI